MRQKKRINHKLYEFLQIKTWNIIDSFKREGLK